MDVASLLAEDTVDDPAVSDNLVSLDSKFRGFDLELQKDERMDGETNLVKENGKDLIISDQHETDSSRQIEILQVETRQELLDPHGVRDEMCQGKETNGKSCEICESLQVAVFRKDKFGKQKDESSNTKSIAAEPSQNIARDFLSDGYTLCIEQPCGSDNMMKFNVNAETYACGVSDMITRSSQHSSYGVQMTDNSPNMNLAEENNLPANKFPCAIFDSEDLGTFHEGPINSSAVKNLAERLMGHDTDKVQSCIHSSANNAEFEMINNKLCCVDNLGDNNTCDKTEINASMDADPAFLFIKPPPSLLTEAEICLDSGLTFKDNDSASSPAKGCTIEILVSKVEDQLLSCIRSELNEIDAAEALAESHSRTITPLKGYEKDLIAGRETVTNESPFTEDGAFLPFINESPSQVENQSKYRESGDLSTVSSKNSITVSELQLSDCESEKKCPVILEHPVQDSRMGINSDLGGHTSEIQSEYSGLEAVADCSTAKSPTIENEMELCMRRESGSSRKRAISFGQCDESKSPFSISDIEASESFSPKCQHKDLDFAESDIQKPVQHKNSISSQVCSGRGRSKTLQFVRESDIQVRNGIEDSLEDELESFIRFEGYANTCARRTKNMDETGQTASFPFPMLPITANYTKTDGDLYCKVRVEISDDTNLAQAIFQLRCLSAAIWNKLESRKIIKEFSISSAQDIEYLMSCEADLRERITIVASSIDRLSLTIPILAIFTYRLLFQLEKHLIHSGWEIGKAFLAAALNENSFRTAIETVLDGEIRERLYPLILDTTPMDCHPKWNQLGSAVMKTKTDGLSRVIIFMKSSCLFATASKLLAALNVPSRECSKRLEGQILTHLFQPNQDGISPVLYMTENFFLQHFVEEVLVHADCSVIFFSAPLEAFKTLIPGFKEAMSLEITEPKIEHCHIQCAAQNYNEHIQIDAPKPFFWRDSLENMAGLHLHRSVQTEILVSEMLFSCRELLEGLIDENIKTIERRFRFMNGADMIISTKTGLVFRRSSELEVTSQTEPTGYQSVLLSLLEMSLSFENVHVMILTEPHEKPIDSLIWAKLNGVISVLGLDVTVHVRMAKTVRQVCTMIRILSETDIFKSGNLIPGSRPIPTFLTKNVENNVLCCKQLLEETSIRSLLSEAMSEDEEILAIFPSINAAAAQFLLKHKREDRNVEEWIIDTETMIPLLRSLSEVAASGYSKTVKAVIESRLPPRSPSESPLLRPSNARRNDRDLYPTQTDSRASYDDNSRGWSSRMPIQVDSIHYSTASNDEENDFLSTIDDDSHTILPNPHFIAEEQNVQFLDHQERRKSALRNFDHVEGFAQKKPRHTDMRRSFSYQEERNDPGIHRLSQDCYLPTAPTRNQRQQVCQKINPGRGKRIPNTDSRPYRSHDELESRHFSFDEPSDESAQFVQYEAPFVQLDEGEELDCNQLAATFPYRHCNTHAVNAFEDSEDYAYVNESYQHSNPHRAEQSIYMGINNSQTHSAEESMYMGINNLQTHLTQYRNRSLSLRKDPDSAQTKLCWTALKQPKARQRGAMNISEFQGQGPSTSLDAQSFCDSFLQKASRSRIPSSTAL